MEDERENKKRASRMLDDLMSEGLEQTLPAEDARPKGPILPRLRLVITSQAAPMSMTKKRAPAPEAGQKPASEMLPEILKEVDEARTKAKSRSALPMPSMQPAPAPASASEAQPPQPQGRVQKGMSRIRRRFSLGFGKKPESHPRSRRAELMVAQLEDKAIYRSPDEEAPLKVPEHWFESPKLTAWAFLLPALLAFALFAWLPMVRGLLLSFQEVSLLAESKFVGFANYARAFADPLFWATFLHSLLFCALSLALGFWLPVFIAIYLNEIKRGQGLLRLMFFLPFLTPVVPAVILWRWILDQGYGLLNSLVALLGVSDPHIPWLNHPFLAMLSVVMVFLWKNAGWNALIYMTSLREVPEELYEAAELDGASLWKRVWHVSIPSLRPTMAVLFLMQVINAFQIFTEVFLLTGGGPMASTEVVATYLYKKSFLYLDIGYASALAVMLFVALAGLTSARRKTIEQEA